MSMIHVSTTVNGDEVDFVCDPRETLLDVLRDRLALTGAKEGCGTGDCGACSVMVDDRLVCSCLMLGAEAEGKSIATVEGLAKGEDLHPLQEKFIEHAALQCGICTPGILVATKALLDKNPDPTETEVRYWLAGNLCRCTGYDKIIRAVMDTAADLGKGFLMAFDEVKTEGFKQVGTRPRRPDGVDKVTGRAKFGADAYAPGMLHAAIVRSPHAHARILSIDASRAEALKGVKAVVTRADFAEGLTGDDWNVLENVMAGEKALYDGHAVAAVAATSRPHRPRRS